MCEQGLSVLLYTADVNLSMIGGDPGRIRPGIYSVVWAGAMAIPIFGFETRQRPAQCMVSRRRAEGQGGAYGVLRNNLVPRLRGRLNGNLGNINLCPVALCRPKEKTWPSRRMGKGVHSRSSGCRRAD